MINMKFILIATVLTHFIFSSVYNTGETVSISHQNISFNLCYGDNAPDEIKLADFNGDLNDGNYKVIWIDMAATW